MIVKRKGLIFTFLVMSQYNIVRFSFCQITVTAQGTSITRTSLQIHPQCLVRGFTVYSILPKTKWIFNLTL